ncbi:alpha/beta fold hydrolase [uncultured Amnibacterium sp.]|uniref:alpha/beta fold hydrolase n=1 Tax=uncultured Amnibacterium sp. TaxID=1631851 RepID=UPI0035CC7823
MPSFVDAHGVTIATHEWLVPAPRAVVQISHGIGEHARRYAALAADLNEAGFSVVADDHRGHGETGRAQWDGDPARMGRPGPGGLRATIEAVQLYSRITRDRFPRLPFVLLGHSWGSLMAQIAVNAHAADYDGLVLSGTAYRLPGWMDAGDLNRRHRSLGSTGAEWLSRDPEVARAWVADPLTFPAQTAKLLGLRDALRLFGRPARELPADLPVLLQAGGDDTLGGERSVQRLARAYRERSGIRDVTVRVYPGARHEVYNETNRIEVIGDLIAWIETHVLVRPQRAEAADRS